MSDAQKGLAVFTDPKDRKKLADAQAAARELSVRLSAIAELAETDGTHAELVQACADASAHALTAGRRLRLLGGLGKGG